MMLYVILLVVLLAVVGLAMYSTEMSKFMEKHGDDFDEEI